jgi:hypothetical protein
MSRPASLLVASVLLTACTGVGGGVSTTTTAPVDLSGTLVPVGDLPGRLLTLDANGNIVSIAPDGSDPIRVTDDAGVSAQYSQPSWSPESNLVAWSEISTDGFGIGLSSPDGGDRHKIEMPAPPFYLYWSPDGGAIGVLHNGPGGNIDFEMVDTAAATALVAGSGSPFYFSWSPESDEVVAHVEHTNLEVIGKDGTSSDFGTTDAGYQPPQWTPDGVLLVDEDGFVARDPQGADDVLAEVTDPISFAANHDGSEIAIQSFSQEEAPEIDVALTAAATVPADVVSILDVESGALEQVTDAPSIGFFWSPDGESLLILEPHQDGSGEVEMLIRDSKGTRSLGSIALYPSFVREVLQFFDQYAQSLRLWSPDSSAFALVGAIDGQPGVWVISPAGYDPARVSDGTWAVWSED